MPNQSDKVRGGQLWVPPRAELHNEWTDAAIRSKQLAGDPQRIIGSRGNGPMTALLKATLKDLDAGEPIGFGPPLLTSPADAGERREQPILDGDRLPTTGRWAIPWEGIEQNRVGTVVLYGLAWAQVSVLDLAHTHADALTGGTLSTSRNGFARIVHTLTVTGLQWLLLDLGAPAIDKWVYGTADNDINPDTAGDITVVFGSEPVSSTQEVFLDVLHGGQKISAGKGVMARWFIDRDFYIVIGADCE